MDYLMIIEIIAVATGLLSVWFSKKINILVYPIGIVSVLLYVFLFIKNGLYANAVINLIYALISIFGWWNWSRQQDKETTVQDDNGKLAVTFLSVKGRVITSLLLLLSFFVISIGFDTDLSTKLDYATSFLGLGAIILTAYKKVDNWILYLIADIVLIPLCIYNGLYLTSFQYLVYTILAIMGYISWSKEAKKNV